MGGNLEPSVSCHRHCKRTLNSEDFSCLRSYLKSSKYDRNAINRNLFHVLIKIYFTKTWNCAEKQYKLRWHHVDSKCHSNVPTTSYSILHIWNIVSRSVPQWYVIRLFNELIWDIGEKGVCALSPQTEPGIRWGRGTHCIEEKGMRSGWDDFGKDRGRRDEGMVGWGQDGRIWVGEGIWVEGMRGRWDEGRGMKGCYSVIHALLNSLRLLQLTVHLPLAKVTLSFPAFRMLPQES